MIKIYYNELFKEIVLDESTKLRYAMSNYGRLISFVDKMEEGRLLKGGLINGYRILRFVIYKEGVKLYRHKMLYKRYPEPKTKKRAT